MTKRGGDFTPWLGVFETLRVVNGVPLFMAEHRKELARAMEALELKSDFDFERARAELPSLSGRWRWIVTPERTGTLFSEEPPPSAEPVALSISAIRVGSCNWDARFKTLSYLTHAQAWKMKSTPEVILLNEHGHVASASRANVFWLRGGQLFTPAHEAGCRCGVVREFILKHQSVKLGHYPPDDLLEADEIFFLTGSMKGIVSVNAMQDRSWTNFPLLDTLCSEYEQSVAAQLKK